MTKPLTWNAAEASCRALGSNLAIVRTPAENRAITAKLTGTEMLLGLHRDPKDISRWRWVDGSRPVYFNWDHGEPGNYMGREFCVIIRKHGFWHDTWCKARFPSVCQKGVIK